MEQEEYTGARKIIEDLAPEWTEGEKRVGVEDIRAYAELMIRIYERLEQDPEAMARYEAALAEHKRQEEEESLPAAGDK
ncbi:MAG TPA: hypothetical protein VEB60_01100 [Candidatus Paceibacterota bacterium]|nr:hypothetical protein [Candidatus Paceibacterota bacterium]